jgi:hypothetical protein
MSWEQRGNATYYYRKKRHGDRVVSEYVGRSELAQFAALMDSNEKRDRKRMRAAMRETHTTEERADELLLEFEKMVQVLTRGYLIAQGCHTHKGQWRRKREKNK